MDFYSDKVTELKENISQSANAGTLPHGILVDCENEELSLEFARYIANCIVCKGDKKPCGVCSACNKANSGGHPDIIERDGRTKQSKTFKIEAIREIRSEAFIVPNESESKVYILKNAQDMSEEAQNAFLKILEEPPLFVYFIILTTSKSAMLETVLSRVSSFNLMDETKSIGEKERELLTDFIDAVMDEKSGELRLAEHCSAYLKNNKLAREILGYAQIIFRDALVIKNGYDREFEFDEEAHKLAAALSSNSLMNLTNTADELIKSVDRNINNNLLLIRISYEMRRAISR